MNDEFMLTTTDNPFSPFTQFDEWKRFDEDKGYNTCEYIAREMATSNSLLIEEQDELIDETIEEILLYNINGMYIKVYNTEPK